MEESDCRLEREWGGCALYFEPVGGYHGCEGEYLAIYGYDVLGNVEAAGVAHHGYMSEKKAVRSGEIMFGAPYGLGGRLSLASPS